MATRRRVTTVRSKARPAQPRGKPRRTNPRRVSDLLEQGFSVEVQGLLEAGSAIAGALALDGALRLAAEEARKLIGAHVAILTLALDNTRTSHVVSTSEAYDTWRGSPEPAPRAALSALVARLPLLSLIHI